MTCDGCVKAVSESLSKINGVSTFDVNLKDQLVFIEGTGMLNSSLGFVEPNRS